MVSTMLELAERGSFHSQT